MSNGASNNGTTKWLSVGLFAMFLLAVGGWAFGSFKAAEVKGIGEVRIIAGKAESLAVQNDREIAVLRTQLLSFSETLQEIKILLKEHEARSR